MIVAKLKNTAQCYMRYIHFKSKECFKTRIVFIFMIEIPMDLGFI